MRSTTLSLALVAALLAPSARAAGLNISGSINIGGHSRDFDFHVGGGELLRRVLGGGGLLGGGGQLGGNLLGGGFLGLGGFSAEATQERLAERLTNLKSEYDSGVANTADFYTTDDYADIVNDAERLAARYDFFVTRVEHTIDYLGNAIEFSNKGLTYVQDLIADLEDRDDLSGRRLERLTDVLTKVEGGIQDKIDRLTVRQTMLTESLPTYQTFQTDLSSYLDEIIAAGDGITDGELNSAGALALSASMNVATNRSNAPASSAAASVPEPSTAVLGAFALAMVTMIRRRS